jgi:hypothetical protein
MTNRQQSYTMTAGFAVHATSTILQSMPVIQDTVFLYAIFSVVTLITLLFNSQQMSFSYISCKLLFNKPLFPLSSNGG